MNRVFSPGVSRWCFAVLALVSPGYAGPLAGDPAAIPAYRGTAAFNAADVLKVNLDYAVFAPGAYPDDGVHGIDPSHGSEYVYALQVFNVSGTRNLTFMGIQVFPCSGVSHLGIDPNHVATGGLAPSVLTLIEPGLEIDFLNPRLPAGGHSVVILFTSPNPPVMSIAAVQDGSLTDQAELPMPGSSPPVRPDFDEDCDVDLDDYGTLLACFSGPSILQAAPECQRADLDADHDVDQTDFAVLQRCFSGPDIAPDLGCAD